LIPAKDGVLNLRREYSGLAEASKLILLVINRSQQVALRDYVVALMF